MTRTLSINRAPVLTLWAAVVAERLGFEWEEALTLGPKETITVDLRVADPKMEPAELYKASALKAYRARAPLRDVLLRAEVLPRVPRRADAQGAGAPGHAMGGGLGGRGGHGEPWGGGLT